MADPSKQFLGDPSLGPLPIDSETKDSETKNSETKDSETNTAPITAEPVAADASEDAWQEVDTFFDQLAPLSRVRAKRKFQPIRAISPTDPIVMVETAFLASAASLIWLINSYFPIGPVLRIFFPIPVALIYLRWGARAAWMGTLTCGLLLSVLMGPSRSVLYVMPFGIMGVMLGWLWSQGASWGISIVLGGLLCSIGFFFRIWLTSLLLNEDLWQYANIQVTNMLEWVCNLFGLLIQPQLWVVQLLAALMIVVSQLLYAFVVHLVAVLMLEKLKTPIPPPPRWVQILLEND
jgi:uncharacterized protein YybS (DUF2232 family)